MLRRNEKSSGMFVECAWWNTKIGSFLYMLVSHLFRLGPENRVTLGSGQESATARGSVSAVIAAAHLTLYHVRTSIRRIDPTPKLIG